MSSYGYIALDAGGRRRRGIVEADDPRSARKRLAAQGLLAEQVEPIAVSASRRGGSGLRQPGRRSMVYRELSALIGAGLTLEQGLSAIQSMPEMDRCRAELIHIRDRIREGVGPADALADVLVGADAETAALRAGERFGAIDVALARLADMLDAQVRTRSRLVSALIYPAVVAVLALGVAVAMLGFMLPSFVRVWEDAGVELPRITRAASAFGRVAGYVAPLLAVAVTALFAFPARFAGVRRRLRQGGDRLLDRVRPIARARQALAAARFAQTLALLLRGGVPAVDALPYAGRATGRADLAAAIDERADEVRHGLSLAAALRRMPVLSAPLAPWVEAGEASGDLAGMLELAARREQEAWERGLERGMSLLEPALVLLLGALVFLVALAILLPVFSMRDVVG